MTPNQTPEFNGLLLVHKPTGMSSFDVIRRLRRITGFRKIGHAGTLDPAASGLMLMLFGPACKQADRLIKHDKRYLAEITLGQVSTTGDREGELSPVSDRVPTREEVAAALMQLTGEIDQVPPVYSAIKINGQEAYKRVRKGETVEIPARRVTIYKNRLMRYEYPLIELDCRVSSGTYIRTLAEDLGRMLGTGAYLSALQRMEVDEFKLEEALDLETATPESIKSHLKSINAI
ncbi:MAG TPA: tRNA pseudouridine(55) synthase TruB [Candidatus Saccharimonadia bacterium]